MHRDINKALIITHANCADGLLSAVVVTNYLQRNTDITYDIQYWPCSYSVEEEAELLNHLNNNPVRYIFCVDFSLSVQLIKSIHLIKDAHKYKLADKLFIYDHHASAIKLYMEDTNVRKELNSLPYVHIILDASECGSTLAFKQLFSPACKLPEVLKYVKDRDLWQHIYGKDTYAMHMYIKRIMNTEQLPMLVTKPNEAYARLVEKAMHLLDDYNVPVAMQEGYELLTEYEIDIQKHADRGVPMLWNWSLEPLDVVVVSKLPKEYVSDVGNLLVNRYNTVAMLFAEGSHSVSLRSSESVDIDVSYIAALYGGGGHKYAAGFSYSDNLLQELLLRLS